LEVFGEAEQLLVVTNFRANEHFVAVELSGLVNAFLNLFVNLVNSGGDVSVLIDSLVLLELKNGLLQVGDVLEELLLLELHVLNHLLLQLLKDCSLRFHDADDALGASEEVPLFLLVRVRQVIVELVEDFVSLHNLVDFFLFLLDFDALVRDELFGVCKVFDCFGRLEDLVLHVAKGGRQLLSVVLSNRRDQLDVFLADLGVLALVGVADVLAVDEEHGNLDLVGDSGKKLFLVLELFVDIVTDQSGGGWELALALLDELGNILVRVEVVLGVEGTVGLDVLVEGHDGALQVVKKLLEGVPKPGILVQELGFVARIGGTGLGRWDDGSLDCLRVLRLEELLEKHGLEMRDLLETLDTLLEDILDLGNDLLGVV